MLGTELALAIVLASPTVAAAPEEPYPIEVLSALENKAWARAETGDAVGAVEQLLALAREPHVPVQRRAAILLDATGLAARIAADEQDTAPLCAIKGALGALEGDAELDTSRRTKIAERRAKIDAYLAKLNVACADRAADDAPSSTGSIEPEGPAAAPSDPPIPARVADRKRRQLVVPGAVMTSVGLAALGGTIGSIVVYHQAVGEMRSITRKAEQTHVTTTSMNERMELLDERQRAARAVGITTAVAGGASLVTGIVLLALDRRARRLELQSTAAPGHAGLALRGRF
ncbi:MAG: hypothetical protein R3A51_16440 [Nannocystaceae bacterium]